jgi:hypothetical protein
MNLDGVEEDLVELDDLVDGFPQINGYENFEALGEGDIADLALIKALFGKKKQLWRIKYYHTRKNWEEYAQQLTTIDDFTAGFWMSRKHFDFLLEAMRDASLLTISSRYSPRVGTIQFLSGDHPGNGTAVLCSPQYHPGHG